MFHPKQSSKPALILRVLGKSISSLLNTLARHPLVTGFMLLVYLVAANPANMAHLQSAMAASDFPETALGALIFSALLMAVIYAFARFVRQILTALGNDE
ncbi:hypothetical protein [Enterobacter sp. Colony194]|uniref:hypothetical protein n=1 Tax=Enterobacter sp. Colony194 TaxID=2866201 RepID=UPI001C6A6270|nr:hypothetical protein [Enterobacter sp. Colony194]